MALTTTIIGASVRGVYDNVKDTFPASIAPTSGTVSTKSSLKQIIGVGTVFISDVNNGDFIWFTTTDELVEVLLPDGGPNRNPSPPSGRSGPA